ncbi:hypothetical protein BT69DRAFT_1066395 [Atractiella rhizophila]|nr:hypothetical protein BT69DRAFT_1066395 [Atractiella rhizophila]
MSPRTVADYADALFNVSLLVTSLRVSRVDPRLLLSLLLLLLQSSVTAAPIELTRTLTKPAEREKRDMFCLRSQGAQSSGACPPGSRSSRRSEECEIPRSGYLRNSLWNGCERLLDPSADSSKTAVQLQRPPHSTLTTLELGEL